MSRLQSGNQQRQSHPAVRQGQLQPGGPQVSDSSIRLLAPPLLMAPVSRCLVFPRGRLKTPPRPQGQRTEPESRGGVSCLSVRLSVRQSFTSKSEPCVCAQMFQGFGDTGFHMSFGIGAFPFGFFTTVFNANEPFHRAGESAQACTSFVPRQRRTTAGYTSGRRKLLCVPCDLLEVNLKPKLQHFGCSQATTGKRPYFMARFSICIPEETVRSQ